MRAHVVLAKGSRVADGGLEHDVLGLDVTVHDVIIVKVSHGRQDLPEDCCRGLLGVPLELQGRQSWSRTCTHQVVKASGLEGRRTGEAGRIPWQGRSEACLL